MKRILLLSNTKLDNDGTIPAWVNSRASMADTVLHAGDFGSKAAFIKLRDSWKNADGKTKLVAVKGDEDKIWADKAQPPDLGLYRVHRVNEGLAEGLATEIRVGLVHNPLDENFLAQPLLLDLPRGDFKEGMRTLTDIAKKLDVHVLVFGHICQPMILFGCRMLICPGSPASPKDSEASMCFLDVEENGDIDASIFHKIKIFPSSDILSSGRRAENHVPNKEFSQCIG